MTEQEFMQEALEWREHIAKLAADCSDQELFRERLATFDWLIKQAERVQELESDSYNAHLERLLDRKDQEIERYREAINSIIEKVMLLGTNEEVYEAIQAAIKVLEEKE